MPSLTPFQQACGDEVASLFKRYRVEVAFEEGSYDSCAPGLPREEVYLVSSGRVGRSTFRCSIYEDEAGYDQGEVLWRIFEAPDFEDGASLIRAFIGDLESGMAEASVSVDPGPAFGPAK